MKRIVTMAFVAAMLCLPAARNATALKSFIAGNGYLEESSR